MFSLCVVSCVYSLCFLYGACICCICLLSVYVSGVNWICFMFIMCSLVCMCACVCVCAVNLFCVKFVRWCDLIVFHMCCVISLFVLSYFHFVCVSVVGEPPRFSFPFFMFCFVFCTPVPFSVQNTISLIL